ncbi:MAG: enoyl-CoA hydratase/isomerase family protein [Deltaproteobacteria bacterium]|nr:enoyl-CoA hydratase/isomerase family protein [Deltaproteobacteria bacterium]
MILDVHRKDQVCYWTLNQPKAANSLGLRMYHALDLALQQLEEDVQRDVSSGEGEALVTRVLVIRARSGPGRNPPLWVAGGDLKELVHLKSKAQGRDYAEKMTRLCRRFADLPLPVIFEIHGLVIGGGVEFVLAGDFRLASAESCFSLRQLMTGVPCGYGSSSRLISLIGESRAWSLLTKKEPFSAQQAYDWGLLHSLHANPDLLRQATEDLCLLLKSIEPRAFAAQKKMFALTQPSARKTEAELDLFAEAWMNPGHQDFLRRFLERSRV